MRIYNLGIEKTGTASLAGLLRNSSSVHEYNFNETIAKITYLKKGIINKCEFEDYIIDRESNREESIIDISTTNHFYADILLNKIPSSKFILTIRDVESWFISELNWIALINKLLYFSPITYPSENGFETLEFSCTNMIDYIETKTGGSYSMFTEPTTINTADYEIKNNIIKLLLNSNMMEDILKYYYSSNRKVIDLIPKERLLILNINNISKSGKAISEFCEIEQTSLDSSRSRENVSSCRYDYFDYFKDSVVKTRFNKLLTTLQNKPTNISISR